MTTGLPSTEPLPPTESISTTTMPWLRTKRLNSNQCLRYAYGTFTGNITIVGKWMFLFYVLLFENSIWFQIMPPGACWALLGWRNFYGSKLSRCVGESSIYKSLWFDILTSFSFCFWSFRHFSSFIIMRNLVRSWSQFCRKNIKKWWLRWNATMTYCGKFFYFINIFCKYIHITL